MTPRSGRRTLAGDIRVVADGSPLRDGRRDAGIGRYITELRDALTAVPGVTMRFTVPPIHQPESWIRRYLYAQPWIAGDAVRRRAHIVHATASDPVLGWPLKRQVVTLHDVAPWTTHAPPAGTPTFRYLQLQRRRIARCAAVIAVSDTAAAEAETALGVKSERIHVVPEGVGRQFRADPASDDVVMRSDAGVPTGSYLLWVGSLRAHDPRKSLDDLVDALVASGIDVPPLVLTGRAGDEAQRVTRYATERGVTAVVTGYVDDANLAAIYRGAQAVVIPSRHEGFGLTLLEAFACGTPVVASHGGNLRALAGDDALLFPPGDVRALSDAIRSLLTDDALRARLHEAGPKRASGYTWHRTAERTVAVYRRAYEQPTD